MTRVSPKSFCAALSIVLVLTHVEVSSAIAKSHMTVKVQMGSTVRTWQYGEGHWSAGAIEPGTKCSLIDLTGREIIPAKYDSINYHGDGFYRCENKHNSVGKIMNEIEGKDFFIFDRDGKKATLAAYLKCRLDEKKIEGSFGKQNAGRDTEYYEGLAAFKAESHDPKHKTTYMKIYSGKKGNVERVPIVDGHPMRWGYVNTEDKPVIPNNFTEARAFCDGLAIVRTSLDTDPKVYHFINKTGAKVSPEYAALNEFIDGVAIAAVYDNKLKVEKKPGEETPKAFGLIDKTFKFVVKPQYADIKILKPNLFIAVPYSGKNSFLIDRKGTKIASLPQRFEHCTTFNNSDRQWLFTPTLYTKPGIENKAYLIDLKGQVLKVYDDTKQAQDPNDNFHHFGFQADETDWTNGRTLEFKDNNGVIKKIHCNGVDPLATSCGLTVIYINDKKVAHRYRDKFHPLQSVIDVNGKTIIKPERAAFRVTESDRIIKKTYIDHFDSNACKQFKALGSNLSYLLKEHDLIGMSKKQLEDLIGAGQISKKDGTSIYPLANKSQANYGFYDFAQFKFENDKLKAWKLIPAPNSVPFTIVSASSGFEFAHRKPEKPMDWISTNVVCDYWNPTEFRPKK